MSEVKRSMTRIHPASVGREVKPPMASGILQRMWKKEKLGRIN
jgi:hypothetical protein